MFGDRIMFHWRDESLMKKWFRVLMDIVWIVEGVGERERIA